MSEPTSTDESAEPAAVGKGRPTPKRSEARKRRRVATPTNRKEAAALRRQRLREQRTLQRQALLSGDEKNLPPRDAGPGKRLARDYVDSRFTLGQVFFGLIAVVLGLALVPNPVVRGIANLVMLVVFLVVVVTSWMIGRHARDLVAERYDVKTSAGVVAYSMMRAMQPRRMRRPPPRVKRGDTV